VKQNKKKPKPRGIKIIQPKSKNVKNIRKKMKRKELTKKHRVTIE
jgi:hypothetical protein